MNFKAGQTQEVALRNYLGGWQAWQGDEKSGAGLAIAIEHLMVHAGRFYSINDVDTDVDIAGPKEWLFITPGNSLEVHAIFVVAATAACTVELFEEATATVGTPLPAINHDRRSALTSDVAASADPAVTDDGNRIGIAGLGANGGVVALGAARNTEFLLKAGTMYLLRVTVVADNTLVSMGVDYYEYDPLALTLDPMESSSSSSSSSSV
jgi:hypothetical protein